MLLLKNSEGEWNSDKIVLRDLALDYSKKLHTLESCQFDHMFMPNLFPFIYVREFDMLCRKVKDNKVKEALFNMESWEAPGLDDIHASFFQASWDMYGDHICELVKEVFRTDQLHARVNNTIISVIPKVDCRYNILQFRSISICSTLYKIISKVLLVQRLSPLMGNLISPN